MQVQRVKRFLLANFRSNLLLFSVRFGRFSDREGIKLHLAQIENVLKIVNLLKIAGNSTRSAGKESEKGKQYVAWFKSPRTGGVEIADRYIAGGTIPVKPEIPGAHETGKIPGAVGLVEAVGKTKEKV